MKWTVRLTPIDALLLLLVVIWGANFSVIKVSIAEIPPLGFNVLRLVVATAALLVALGLSGAGAPARREWRPLLALGLGLACYQLSFVTGLARTTATNSAVILGCMPVAVLLLNAVSRQREHVNRLQWAGVALAFVGVYLVVGAGAGANWATLDGDLIIVISLWCWAWYTVGSRGVLTRCSPLQVTTSAMVVCTVILLPTGIPDLVRLDWSRVNGWAWVATVVSGVLALSVSHIIWYTGVQQLGSARTSVYSNLVPVAAMTVAALWLREPIGWMNASGAALVLGGLLLARVERTVVASA